MIKIEKTDVYGWESAIRGMRNPMNSWDNSDSDFRFLAPDGTPSIGPNDLALMKKLSNGGADHGKFLRFISVSADVTAPLYWWKEYDTYKVGTVANSCSTMHKITEKEFSLEDFSCEHLLEEADCKWGEPVPHSALCGMIFTLNWYRNKYLAAKTKPMKEESKRSEVMKRYWWQIIQLLPSSYNQKRTVLLNYQVLKNLYHARKTHKLDEWRDFCKWIETLPYSELITGGTDG
jgi:hypothetical protein